MEHTIPSQAPVKHKPSGMSICVKNIPSFADDLWMYRRFSQFGAIHSVRAMISPETLQCMGLGFVNFVHPMDGQSAIANMNGSMVDGKRLQVEMQRPRRKPAVAPVSVVDAPPAPPAPSATETIETN